MFEFMCRNCGHEFEELLLSVTGQIIRCPECSSADVEKKFSSFSSAGSVKSSSDCGGFT